jgi:hypothetical protein
MNRCGTEHRFPAGKGGRLSKRSRAFRTHRAVSDVVATILLLALTVVLFASIFAFVTQFPSPPAQNSNQFQANLVSGPNGTGYMATEITILHLSGPAVPLAALIYLKSSVYPNGPEFQAPYSLTAGGIPAGHVWNLGQTWVLNANFTGGFHPILPDNITVFIVSSSNLLFTVVLPGLVINTPPTFLAVGTSPTVPVVGGAFTIFGQIQGVYSPGGGSATITVSGLPGMSAVTGAQKMTYSAATGLWTYAMATGNTTASGTYYAFITATSLAGKVGTASVTVTITPYTTLISSALTLTSPVGATATCTGAKTPVAACQASGDYYYKILISSSSVTFGSVLFQISKGATIFASSKACGFALSPIGSLGTADASWSDTTSPYAPQMPYPGFLTFAAGFSGTSALTTGFAISADLGTTTTPAGGGWTLVVTGIGSYSGTLTIALP